MPHEMTAGNKRTILLVEDEAVLAMTEKMSLETYGYSVITVDTGEKAVETVKNTTGIDLILMDIDLGKGLDGTEAAALILQDHDIPVVFCSSHTEPEIVEKTEKITSYGYVVKSAGTTVLDASIKMAFKLFESSMRERNKEKALRKSKKTSDMLLNVAAEIIVSLDEHGIITLLNESGHAMLGYESPSLIGKKWFDTCLPEGNRLDVKKYFEQLKKGEAEVIDSYENEVITKTGEYRTVQWHNAIIKDEHGNFATLFSSGEDITERKQAELALQEKNEAYSSLNKELRVSVEKLQTKTEELEAANEEMQVQNEEMHHSFEIIQQTEAALRESEERYRLLHENAGIGIGYYKPDGTVISYNRLASSHMNGVPEDYAGKSIYELFPKQEAEFYLERIKKACLADAPMVYEDMVPLPSGKIFFQSTFTKITNKENKILGVQIISQDITKRKQAEEAFHQASERFSSILLSMNDAIYSVDSNSFTLLLTNDAIEKIFGRPKEDFYANPGLYAEMVHPDDKAIIARSVKELFENKSGEWIYRIVKPDGEIRWVSDRSKLICDKNGSAARIDCIFTDITERKLAENRIASLLAEKELLLREVNHRIKNNMNAMRSMLMLQASTLCNPEANAALEDASKRMQSMEILYDRLYQSTGFSELSIATYLSPLVDAIIANFPQGNLLTVEKHIDDFVLDAKRLQPLGIIVNELLTNTMKYAFPDKSKGKITVSAVLNGEAIIVMLQDNGIGMPELVNFENSTGFGLRLVHGLTKQLNGTIRIERGNGTRISLEFER